MPVAAPSEEPGDVGLTNDRLGISMQIPSRSCSPELTSTPLYLQVA